ncbi:hypothetical protein CBR_g18828 [Chara braunii]|uniref:Reverse transcriptase RNase H-like domain-containing protein n=1 Tax=Chara braunii TaxID=69332 RepID=A0A388KWH6_CHABU|nr:hypothetical protein CBR_g18828 [Chara braunii]|eukprot:GBG74416.1 hypothetical protein CBR_g18828 [Chara braunii]
MVTTKTGFSTTPYSKEQEERVVALLHGRKEKMEKRELIKHAKMLALLEEQEAKKRQMEEELKKEQEEKMAAIQEEVEKEEEIEEVEEEEPLERRRGEASTSKEIEIARIAEEWAAHLDLEVKVDAMHAGFKDFGSDIMKYLLAEVHNAISKTQEFCIGAIEGAKLATPKEEEPAPPRREKVKVRFPEPFSGKKGEDFDSWEANVHSYLYLQGVTPEDHVLVAFQALRDEATSFARSLARAANCDNDMVMYSRLTPLLEFLKSLRKRFSDVTRELKASDKLQMIHTRQWKSVHALKSFMDELIAVPGHGVTDAHLLNLFYRALPENIQGHFFEKKNQQGMTYDTLSREAVAFAAQASPVTTFWHKDLSKGKTWKGRTILGQIKVKDSLILTMEEGGADEVPYSEWGLEEENNGAGQGRTYAAVAAGGRPQGGGQWSGRNGRAPGGREQGGQGVGGNGNRQEGGRGGSPPNPNYYRKFMRNFSTIVAPLRRLLKKETIWKWDQDCMSAFKKLKKALIEYPVLKVADPSLSFVVTTDASQYGIGVVLQQDDDNGDRPVEFMSARMPSEKVAASTYERELYALRQALEHWKHYLLGRHFKVYSDHETLRWLKTQAKMTPKLTRWAAEIDQHDFELKPIKGKYNVVADALSSRSDYFGAIVHYLDIRADLQQKVRDAYAQDLIYSELLKRVREAPDSQPYYRTMDGLLFEKTNVADRLCVPNSEEIRSLVLGECHDTERHFGWQKL